MGKNPIALFSTEICQEAIDAVVEVLKSGWTGLGPKTVEFEAKFSKYIGAKYAVATNSCTGALKLSLDVIGLKSGDEVITTPMTFVSTNHVILYSGATPVFCDIEPDTLNIDHEKIEELITSRTKAIMIVHYSGQACALDEIRDIATQHDLKLIGDTAHGCGGEYKSKKLDTVSDLACYSFHAVKNLPTGGDGGMAITNNEDYYKRMMKQRWLGIDKSTWARSGGAYTWRYNVDNVGFKSHMNDVTAAIGIEQLKHLEKMNDIRRSVAAYYDKNINPTKTVLPARREYAKTAQHTYVIKVKNRDDLLLRMKENNIACGVHYYPNHLYSVYRRFYRKLPVAESVWKEIICLPCHTKLTEDDLARVVEVVNTNARI